MRTVSMLLAGVAALLITAPVQAATVDEVIAKHIEARGGRDSWAAIESMKITGSYTAFSKVSPFTLHKKRDNLFHIDHVLDDKRVIIGYDGEVAWWDNPWRQEGVQKIGGIDFTAQERNFDFVTPLFDVGQAGYTAKLLGDVEVEGIPAVGIELTRPDETVETWYLDPETHLELARMSPGSDFGNPMPQLTFFDDFREVHGVVIPFLTEAQWYTRSRAMQIEEVAINVDIDDAMFAMPAPEGMGPLLDIVGNWNVAVQQRQQPGQDWQNSERSSSIESLFGGGVVRETYTTAGGNQVLRTLSYDRFKKRYRVTEVNDARNLMDVLEGTIDDDGRLSLNNVETDTSWAGFGMTFHTRAEFFDIGADGFSLEEAISIDGGENWFVAGKSTYTRAE